MAQSYAKRSPLTLYLFVYRAVKYCLSVTETSCRLYFLSRADGVEACGQTAYLTSVGEGKIAAWRFLSIILLFAGG